MRKDEWDLAQLLTWILSKDEALADGADAVSCRSMLEDSFHAKLAAFWLSEKHGDGPTKISLPVTTAKEHVRGAAAAGLVIKGRPGFRDAPLQNIPQSGWELRQPDPLTNSVYDPALAGGGAARRGRESRWLDVRVCRAHAIDTWPKESSPPRRGRKVGSSKHGEEWFEIFRAACEAARMRGSRKPSVASVAKQIALDGPNYQCGPSMIAKDIGQELRSWNLRQK